MRTFLILLVLSCSGLLSYGQTYRDEAKINELSKFFRKKVDKFENTVEYIPKSAPRYISQSGIYCSFTVRDGIARELYFTLHKTGGWLYIQKIEFLIDGKLYEYIPGGTTVDYSMGKEVEWISESVLPSGSDRDAIDALAVLGYSRSDAMKAVLEAAVAGMSAEDIIKAALRKLVK